MATPAGGSPRRSGVIRPQPIPDTAPRPRRYPDLEPHVEVCLSPPGALPVRVILPASQATPERLAALEQGARDLPRLAVGTGRGAIDIRLDSVTGAHVKTGAVVLGPRGRPLAVPLDPTTRRFRLGDVPAGEYEVRAAAAEHGRVTARFTVRAGDVVRAALRLDGTPPRGTTSLRFAVDGVAGRRIRVRATNRGTGQVVYERTVAVTGGVATLAAVPSGSLHFEFIHGDDRSCYDADVTDLVAGLEAGRITLTPAWQRPWPEPDPPGWLVLPEELDGLRSVLPLIGIGSMEDLAAAQPETLMHRQLDGRGVPVHPRLFAAAIEAARQQLGLAPTAGETGTSLRLGRGGSLMRAFRLAAPGTVEIDVDLGAGTRGQVIVEGARRVLRVPVTGRRSLSLAVSATEVASARLVRVTVVNRSGRAAVGRMVARLPGATTAGFATIPQVPIGKRIENILAALAVQNPGLGTALPPGVLTPENIRGWLDQARTIMIQAGVCSINDLGMLRIEPGQKLAPGVYMAPAAPPQGGPLPTLAGYKLASVIGDTVLHYAPNDVLHEWAIILAGTWDIRGQVVYVGQEVRELLVIAESVTWDGGSAITWEQPKLPGPLSYWPNPEENGIDGFWWGDSGGEGEDGDLDPAPSKNGGTSAVLEAPTVTMYLLDATSRLPPILLSGQEGGPGGQGQDGGNGGDGRQGLRASGTFFGGCCRQVGWGGNGGRAGNGGRGGRGGNGSAGGRFTLLTTAPGIVALEADPPYWSVRTGTRGAGGPGGQPGVPGKGGPAGTADCEIWCDEHPERRGQDGAPGSTGPQGLTGLDGPPIPSDAIQILPITEAEWNEAFTSPHILAIDPTSVVPGDSVSIKGANFDPQIDRVFFDGTDQGPVSSATAASFTVPGTAEGGYHPVVVRPAVASERKSNQVLLQVRPRLEAITSGRWLLGSPVTLTGLAFSPGCQVLAEDLSTSPSTKFNLPTDTVSKTQITLQVPNALNLRGVRRIKVRNPDGGTSNVRIARLGDVIVVRCAAFRLVGQTSLVTSLHSKAEIAALFVEGAPVTLTDAWSQARIAFELVQPVKDVFVDDWMALVFPRSDPSALGIALAEAHAAAPFMPGALNCFFVRDVDDATAFALYGGGPLVIGDEPAQKLGPLDFRQLVAHEVGHALCLAHVCDAGDDPDPTLFGRVCLPGDETFLMYPYWNVSDGLLIPEAQVDQARVGATHFERGKTAALGLGDLMQEFGPPQCMAEDTEN